MTDEALPDDPAAYVLALQEELAGWHQEWSFGDRLRLLAMVVELSLQALPAESKGSSREIGQLRYHLQAVRGKARGLVWSQFMGPMETIAAAERKQLEATRKQLEAARKQLGLCAEMDSHLIGTTTESDDMGEPAKERP